MDKAKEIDLSHLCKVENILFSIKEQDNRSEEMAQQIKSAQKVANITKESIMWTFMVQALQDDGIKYALEQLAAKGGVV